MLLLVSDCITEAWVRFIDVSTGPRAYVGFCLNEAGKLPRAPPVKRKQPHFAPSQALLNWSLKVKCSESPVLTFSFEVVKHSGNTGHAEGKLGGYNRRKATDQTSHQNPQSFLCLIFDVFMLAGKRRPTVEEISLFLTGMFYTGFLNLFCLSGALQDARLAFVQRTFDSHVTINWHKIVFFF